MRSEQRVKKLRGESAYHRGREDRSNVSRGQRSRIPGRESCSGTGERLADVNTAHFR